MGYAAVHLFFSAQIWTGQLKNLFLILFFHQNILEMFASMHTFQISLLKVPVTIV